MAQPTNGVVTGTPAVLLRLEGLTLAIAATYFYHVTGGPWLWFGILFLSPDLFMVGYLKGPKWGAFTYNLVHTTTLYIALAAVGRLLQIPWCVWIGMIGLSHIGMDRVLGFGLKYSDEFKLTHLSKQT